MTRFCRTMPEAVCGLSTPKRKELAIPNSLFHKVTQASDIAVAVGFFALLLGGCQGVDINEKNYDKSHFYFIDSPNQRKLNPDVYFSHEYSYINSRNGSSDSVARPKHLAGLAFSGGGIRSAAFQLGMLAGLHQRGWLSRIDYIASVSGGSWANGSYWSNSLTDEKFLDCLNRYAMTGVRPPDCAAPYNSLRDTQEISPLPFDNDAELRKRKSLWEEDIVDAHLRSCNFDFDADPRKDYNPDTALSCRDASVHRPYPIFVSTHSPKSEKASDTHHIFESTPHYQGTISEDEGYKGFFLKSGSRQFLWENRDWKRWLPGGEKDHPGEVLSLILAHSSGVIGSNKPFLLEYNFHVHYRDDRSEGKPIIGLRKIYKLNDGGKSDNLGLIPLLERSVGTIVVSQMGKEGDDFVDITLAASQAKRLFGCSFVSNWPRNTTPIVVTTPYGCPNADGTQQHGILILVRPTVQNVRDFLDYLRSVNPGLADRVVALDESENSSDRFPETPTFRQRYDPALIRAYFLLGKYLAETSVRNALDAQNAAHTKVPNNPK